MADYIERQAALDDIQVALEREAREACIDLCVDDPAFSRCMARYNGIKAVRELVEKRPAANVREDVQGYWKGFTCPAFRGCDEFGDPVYRDTIVYYCSECDRKTVIKENFCPNCGARMAGGGER